MRHSALLLLAIITLAGCTQSGSASTAPSPGGPANAQRSAESAPSSPSTGTAQRSSSPSPPAGFDLPLSTVALGCRLPVLTTDKPPYGSSGGFIQFPAATYQPDPAGVINAVGDGEYATVAKPVLQGYVQTGWPYYDLARKRWLPTGSGQTAPDGSSYAFTSPSFGGPDQFLAIVTVADGAVHQSSISLPPQGVGLQWAVADYDGRSVYLIAEQVDAFPAGVWRFDSMSGSLQQLLPVSAGHVLHVANGVAWVGQVNPHDPSPPRPPKGQAFDTIASVNLASGAQTTWIYRPGQSVVFWGLESSGHPLLMITSGPDFAPVPELTLVDVAGGNGTAIPAGFLPLGLMEADAGRVWFGGPHGIYYWTASTGLLKVYAFQPDPLTQNQQVLLPAGHCV